MPKFKNPMKVITGPRTRWSYVHVWTPSAVNGQNPKYSVCLLIPKDDKETVDKIKTAIKAAYQEGISKLKGNSKSVPSFEDIKNPLHDGDKERPKDETYQGCYFVNANNREAPGIVDADRNDILDKNEVYSGCYGRASINFYAYNSGGSKGIACSLNNLQKISDGEPLGGTKSKAYDDFDDDDDDEDFLG